MKNTLAAAMLLLAGQASAQGTFTIKGHVDGLPDSVRVSVIEVGDPNGRNASFADGHVIGGDFNISGEIKRPGLAKLSLGRYDAEHDSYRSILSHNFMIEPGDYTVSLSAPVDSIRKMSHGVENFVNISGGKAQEEYMEYLAATAEAQRAADEASYKSASMYFKTNDDKDTMRKYDAVKKATAKALLDLQHKFCKEHPAYQISSWLVQQELVKDFVYTAPEIEEMAAMVSVNPDTAMTNRTDRFRKFALRYALGSECADFSVTTPDGAVKAIRDILEPGKFTFIDFWASWCGPCRSAIPHVRELYGKYGDRLKVVSVSVDESDAAWRKAMDDEKMEWSQFHAADEDQMTAVSKGFFLQSIPRLIVLDREGRVVCSTFLPDEASECLSKYLD